MGTPQVRNDLVWEEDLVCSHVVHLLLEGIGHLQDGVKKSPDLLQGHLLLGQVHQLGMDVSQGLIGVSPSHR